MTNSITIREAVTETEDVTITVEILEDPKDLQLLKLQNSYKKEIGEEAANAIIKVDHLRAKR